MSLTSFIKQPAIREGFRSAIIKPSFRPDKPMLAPPLTTNYRLVGTAFDYLLRFYLERFNPDTKTRGWVAELGVGRFLPGGEPDMFELAESYLDDARQHYKTYLQNGVLTDELISASLRLTYFDWVFRSGVEGFNEENLQTLDERDIADLRALMSIVPEQDFKAQKACYLNPTFGSASPLVGGADADIIIDDKLIDIKTTKELKLKPDDLYQLVGYYILLSLGGMDGGSSQSIHYFEEVCEINYLCIYYSRHGYLHTMKIADLIAPESLPNFVKWFIEAACPAVGERLDYCSKFHGQIAKQLVEEMSAAHSSNKKTPKKIST